MRTILSGLVALICVSTVGQLAKAQTALPVSATAVDRQQPGDAPAPPILRKAAAQITNERLSEKSAVPVTDQGEVGEEDVVRVSTSLISVPAQVMDRSGRYIGGLRKEDFVLYENGVEQQLSYFGSVEQPFTVALVLDVSGSTQTQLQAIRAAANAFISRLRPNNQLILVSFDGKINILTGPERIECGWWDGRPVYRDYFVGRNPHGETMWLYRDHRDPTCWHLHGYFS